MHELYRENLNAGYHLPLHYGEDRMILMLRDPYWLFSYWEITGGTLNHYRQKYHQYGWDSSTPIIRVYRFPIGLKPLNQPELTFDIKLSHNVNSWHLNVGMPNRTYYAEMGRKLPGGEYIPIISSNSVNTPRDSESDIIDEEWRLFSLQQRIYRRMTMYHLSSAELQWKGIDPEDFENCNDSHIKIIKENSKN